MESQTEKNNNNNEKNNNIKNNDTNNNNNNQKKVELSNQVITITFGEVAENHVGNQQLGQRNQTGFSVQELQEIQKTVPTNFKTELVDLRTLLPKHLQQQAPEASILIIRKGVDWFLEKGGKTALDLLQEQEALVPDKKYLDVRRQAVLNKRARWNLCFDENAQSANYEQGKGTVVPFKDVPCLEMLYNNLPILLNQRAKNLKGEGNYYYDPSKCGISFHGDAERKIVIAFRLGRAFPLYYRWYQNRSEIGDIYTVNLDHADMYVMSEKATGFDWMSRSIPLTIRHAVGERSYVFKDKKQ